MSAESEQFGDSGDSKEEGAQGTEDGGSAGYEDREGREEIRKLEEADEVPSDPHDWPGGKAKYLTFGGGEGKADDAFGEGIMAKLGPGDVQHQPDGSVIVRGEKVDNPEDYKGEPIPGGPTDPNAPKLAGEADLSKKSPGGEEREGPGEAEEDQSGEDQSGEDQETEEEAEEQARS